MQAGTRSGGRGMEEGGGEGWEEEEEEEEENEAVLLLLLLSSSWPCALHGVGKMRCPNPRLT